MENSQNLNNDEDNDNKTKILIDEEGNKFIGEIKIIKKMGKEF